MFWFAMLVRCLLRQKLYRDVCLVDVLRAHGFKIDYPGNGPFWALADGNVFLSDWKYLGHIIDLIILRAWLKCSRFPCHALRTWSINGYLRHEVKPVADLSSLGAGKFIAYQNHHFVAIRCFEGQWQINFGNKMHEWEAAFWKDDGSAVYTKCKGGWYINAAQLESMFQIVAIDSVVDVTDGNEADVAGGRGGGERTPAEWCKSFSLLDGQVCDHSNTCVVTDRIGGCESAISALCTQYFFRSPIQQEDFPRVWHQLRQFHFCVAPVWPTLTKCPHLFFTLPSPFDLAQRQKEWDARLWASRMRFELLQEEKYVQFEAAMIAWFWPEIERNLSLLDMVVTARVYDDKSEHCKQLARCWQVSVFYRLDTLKKRLARFVPKPQQKPQPDVCGGTTQPGPDDCAPTGEVEVVSAVSGEYILSCLVERSKTLADAVRTAVSKRSRLPYFAIDVLTSNGLVDPASSWEDCGCPDVVFMVQKPRTLDYTEDLFAAIEAKDERVVYQCLHSGQDPDCVFQDSALVYAVAQNNSNAVATLLKGGAVVDFIPPGGRQAAVHIAAVQSPTILEQLLLSQADPNVPDSGGMRPIHHAMCVQTVHQSEIVSTLLRFGAEILQKDGDGDTAFSLAPSGRSLAVCMVQCWDNLTMVDLFQRHAQDFANLDLCLALWQTCSALHRERRIPSNGDVAGGSTVSCVHACTGKEICSVSLLEDATMILLRQEIAHHVQHLPFAIVLLAEENVIPRECTWAAIGCPPVLRVVLKPVTRESSQALTHAIVEQNHAVQILLEWKADVHIKDSHGETPLHFAAASENKIIVKHLVLAGADALATDHDSDIPLLWTSDTDSRAALMDGCWHELSFLTLMLMNINLLAEFLDQDALQPVCRSLRRHMPLRDAFGGSSSSSLCAPQEHTTDDDRNVCIANNRNVARERKMRRLVTWTDSGMQVPVRGDGVDALLPFNYQYFAPCQDILTLAWLHPHPRDRLVRFQAEGHLYFVQGKKIHHHHFVEL